MSKASRDIGCIGLGRVAPALVNLDVTTTFTPKLVLKDTELGLSAARSHGVLLVELARAAGMKLEPENVKVGDGLQ